MLKSEFHIQISVVEKLRRALLLLISLSILFSTTLANSYTQTCDNCCINQAGLADYETTSNGYVNVNVSEAKQMIESNPNLTILDVRTQEEYNKGHIENAVLIPVSELESRLDELDKDKETLVCCKSGEEAL